MSEETGVEGVQGQEAAAEVKRSKKLDKAIEGTVVKLTEKTTGVVVSVDFAGLPAEIQAKLGPYGLSQKLGDAAAGKSGQAAIDAINKVAEGLAKGEWSTRAPAEEKITKKSILETYNLLEDGKEKKILRAALEKVGFKFE